MGTATVDKEERKKRKEARRAKREQYKARLHAADKLNASEWNPIIIEIVTQHLKKDLTVFQARWHSETPLSCHILSNTPLFWYKKHKWSHKDVKEFFKITEIMKPNLESDL